LSNGITLLSARAGSPTGVVNKLSTDIARVLAGRISAIGSRSTEANQ
jgi:hypothetical protein